MNAHTPLLKPYGMPEGIDSARMARGVEKRLNELLLDTSMALISLTAWRPTATWSPIGRRTGDMDRDDNITRAMRNRRREHGG